MMVKLAHQAFTLANNRQLSQLVGIDVEPRGQGLRVRLVITGRGAEGGGEAVKVHFLFE